MEGYNAAMRRVTRRRFLQLTLALPYLALLLSAGIMFALRALSDQNSAWSVVFGIFSVFTITSVIWGPLYTWLVIILLLWGRGRSTEDVFRMYLFTPLILAGGMGVPALLIGSESALQLLLSGVLHFIGMDGLIPALFPGVESERFLAIGLSWLVMAVITIAVGYLFVGIVYVTDRALRRRDVFKDETIPADKFDMPPMPG